MISRPIHSNDGLQSLIERQFSRHIMATCFAFLAIGILGSPECVANESWANAYMGPQSPGIQSTDTQQRGIQSGGNQMDGSHAHSDTAVNQYNSNQSMRPNAHGSAAQLPPLGQAESHDRRIAPYAGHYGHTQQSPSFRWGWFGAEHFYPQVRWHEGYNGDLVRWSNQRRY